MTTSRTIPHTPPRAFAHDPADLRARTGPHPKYLIPEAVYQTDVPWTNQELRVYLDWVALTMRAKVTLLVVVIGIIVWRATR